MENMMNTIGKKIHTSVKKNTPRRHKIRRECGFTQKFSTIIEVKILSETVCRKKYMYIGNSIGCHMWQNGGSKTKLVSVLGRRPDVHVCNLRSFPKVLFLSWKFKKMVTWKVVKQSLQSVIWAIITWPLAWNSTMSCFNIMQTKIHSAVLKAFPSAFWNSPKKFWFWEVVRSTQWF